MNEYDQIRCMASAFSRSRLQQNALFACDAEILALGDQRWALSMDAFTPEEDGFSDEDPFLLGWNLAVATVSDLFAAGAEPAFYMHAVSLAGTLSGEFSAGLMQGIAAVLEPLDCSLCGGDTGRAVTWRYCGFAMGPVRAVPALTRRIPEGHHKLWVTGTVGDASLAVLRGGATPRFELRNREAALIRSHASGCIDTSGGLIDALWLLSEQNPALRFDLLLEEVPLAAGVMAASTELGVPPEAALLAGAGEYELLFTTPAGLPSDVDRAFRAMGVRCIGSVSVDATAGVCLHRRDGQHRMMRVGPPCPRSVGTTDEHMEAVFSVASTLFGGSD